MRKSKNSIDWPTAMALLASAVAGAAAVAGLAMLAARLLHLGGA